MISLLGHRARRLAHLVSLRACLLFVLLPRGANAQTWERDPDFSIPILESSVSPEFPFVRTAALPDGRVLVVTTRYFINGARTAGLVRFNRDGTVDSSYTPPTFPGAPRIAHVYNDGRALVTDGASQLLRLLPDGPRDPTFAATPLEAIFDVMAASTSTGRIWLWGSMRIGSKMTRLALLKPDGGWDEGFQLSPDTIVDVSDAATRPDGRLLVAARTNLPGPIYRDLVLLNFDGSADLSFDASATFPASASSSSSPTALVVLPDGKILAARGRLLVRLLSDGSRDSSFSPSSGIENAFGDVRRANSSGNFYYFTPKPNLGVQLNRITSDGRLDPSFKVDGSFSVMINTNNPSVLTTWDERTFFFANAVTDERKSRRLLVTRVDATGAIDAAFSPRFSTIAAIGIPIRQADGKYLLSGLFDYVGGTAYTPAFSNLVRLNANGSLDQTFRAPIGTSSGGTFYSVDPIAVQLDGKIIATAEGGRQRLNPDGSRDITIAASSPIATATYADGAYYRRETDNSISRWSTEGVRDPAFATGPIQNLSGFSVAANGRLVCNTSGNSTTPRFTWINRDGTISHTASLDYNYSRAGATMVVLPDAGLFVVGDLTTAAPNVTAARIYRYDSSGIRTVIVDLPSDLMSVASALRDSVAASGGGDASLSLANLNGRGRAQLHDNQLILLPNSESDPRFGDAYPIARYRLKDTSLPAASLAPVIFLQPTNRVAGVGNNITFTANAYGAYPRTYQWLRNGVPVGPPEEIFGIGSVLSLRNIQSADAGDYTLRIVNAYGSATSQPASLRLREPPAIIATAPSVVVTPGQTVALTISATGENLSYSYRFNGLVSRGTFPGEEDLSGGTFSILLPSASAADSGVYNFLVSNGGTQTATSGDVRVTVSPTAAASRLANVSVRTLVGSGDRNLVLGFVVGGASGNATQPVLMRGIGPALGPFGVSGFLSDPILTLRSGINIVANNDNWGGNQAVTAAAAQVGAFPLSDVASRDAAIYAPSLSPGAYTAQISSIGSASGVALAEIYDATSNPASAGGNPRLINLSCLKALDAEDTLIAGFVIAGESAKTLLIRAVGSGLAPLGVSGTLSSSQLTIINGSGQKMAEHLGSGYNGVPFNFAARVGAFALPPSSRDNMLAVTLPPGDYTAQVRGTNRASGLVLIEIYEVP